MPIKRWAALSLLILFTICSLCPAQAPAESASGDASTEQDLLNRAREIHRSVLTLDTHVDIPGAEYATEKLDPGIDHPELKCDLVKMAEGEVDAVFLVVYVGQGRRDAEGYAEALSDATAKFDAIHRLTKTMYPGRCELATSPDDVERIAKTGKRVVMIGVENGYPIGTDLSNLKRFYDLGARYVTLSHNGHNQICDSCNPSDKLGDARSEHDGLSEFGDKVVVEMNRLGMMIDVSHIAIKSFWDLVDQSRAPLIASHSGCRAVEDHPRNLHDDQLGALAAGGGVVQLVALDSFLEATTPERQEAISDLAARLGILFEEGYAHLKGTTGEQRKGYREGMKRVDELHPPANLEVYVDHLEHAVRVAGIDHVGIGTDFDGGGGIPGFSDHSEALNVTVELVRRGYSEEEIAKIWGGNLLRVWRDVERIAAELKQGGKAAAERVVDVGECGAVGDGKTLSTESIQKAIDRCAAEGGGTVHFGKGTWLSGTIYLASGVTLLLDPGATLLGSRDPKHYAHPRTPLGEPEGKSYRHWALIAGENLQRVGIRGEGTIDGQGDAFRWKDRSRPKGIYLIHCRDVAIEGVAMRNAGSWMQHYRQCDRVTIRGINVFNHASYNNDGLNIDGCHDVSITECRIDSDDDGIVLKSLSSRPCENVTVRDCTVSSHCNALKMGTESGGGFKNVTVADCTVFSPKKSKVIYGRQRGLAGVALEIVDGGAMEGVTVSNIDIEGVSVPIFMRLGNRARQYEKGQPKPGVGTFRNVVVSEIAAKNTSEIGCSITGLPGHRIENVVLKNIKLGFDGGGTRDQASRAIPERPESYPESTMFGVLPAYGFYCRHVKGLKFENVSVQTARPDLRHALVLDDAEDVLVDGLDAAFSPGAAAMIRLKQVKGAVIRNSGPKGATETFLRLEGEGCRGIVL
ncbi:MAG: membrane dipeptidase, partial [Planctomycetes bacterium]|nr:membrane dipeptidase [Planctomycetota bacterium]